MTQWALHLQHAIGIYLICPSAASVRHFELTNEEWQQLGYLCDLLSSFYVMTTSLSELEEPTVHQVFDVYDTLFDHIEFSMNKLQCKRIEWKVKI